MSLLFASLPAIPLGTGGRYVAAAYIVAFLVLVIYVAIMATRAQRLERDLDALRRDVEAARAQTQPPAEANPATVLTGGERRSA